MRIFLTKPKEVFNKNFRGNADKIFLVSSLIFPLPLIAILALNLYLYDPAQLFHKPYWRPNTFFDDMSVSAQGIIDYYDFDSYIVGTSMLENTLANEAAVKLGGKWVNLSLSGSPFGTRARVLEYLFARQKPLAILYSLDLHGFDESPKERTLSPFLYNSTNFDDWRFYINDRFILCSLVWSGTKKCVGDRNRDIAASLVRWDLRDGNAFGIEKWFKRKDEKYYKELLQSIVSYKNSQNDTISKALESTIKQGVQREVFSFIAKHPNTQFYFVIPTYSRLHYKLGGMAVFAHFREIFRWLVNELEKYPNATLYGFDNLDYADNLANYKDLTHYNVDMNSMQLDAIANKTHIITSQNVESYFEIMKQKIQDYDVEPLIKMVKEAGL